MGRYIIADPAEAVGWGHIFSEFDDLDRSRERERGTRFVWDWEAGAIVHLEIHRNQRWESATRDEILDLTDSLVNANPEALENPEGWPLLVEDRLPDWAVEEPVPAF